MDSVAAIITAAIRSSSVGVCTAGAVCAGSYSFFTKGKNASGSKTNNTLTVRVSAGKSICKKL